MASLILKVSGNVGGPRLLALAGTSVAAFLLVLLALAGQDVHPTNAVLVFLLLTLLVCANFGLKAGLPAAVLADTALVFFFFEPAFVPWTHDGQLQVSVGVFLVVSIGGGLLLEHYTASLPSRSGLVAAASMPSAAPDAVSAADSTRLEIDLQSHIARLSGEELSLTPTEFDLLCFLVQHQGRVISHQTILAEVWGEQYKNDSAILRTYIKQLRAKLGDDPANPQFIRTETRLGYRFMEP